jgi:hypothetical protein
MPRHARAVILFGGWLLMLPPIKGDDGVNTHAPVSTWEHLHSYDTAGDCIADRGRRWTDARKRRGDGRLRCDSAGTSILPRLSA